MDGKAEGLQPFHRPASSRLAVVAIEEVSAEVLKLETVFDEIEANYKHAVGHGHQRPFGSSTSTNPGVLRMEVGLFFVRDAPQAASQIALRSQGLPFLVLPSRCLPALS